MLRRMVKTKQFKCMYNTQPRGIETTKNIFIPRKSIASLLLEFHTHVDLQAIGGIFSFICHFML